MQNTQTHQVVNSKCFPEYKNTFREACEGFEKEIQSREEVPKEDDDLVIFSKITNAFKKITPSVPNTTKNATVKKKTPFRKSQDVFVEYVKGNVAEIDDLQLRIKGLQDQMTTLSAKVDGKAADGSDKNGIKSPRLGEESTQMLEDIEKSSSEMIMLLRSDADCQEAVKQCQSKSRQLEQTLLKDLFDEIVALE